jgi:hypothetical protein
MILKRVEEVIKKKHCNKLFTMLFLNAVGGGVEPPRSS